LIIYNFKLGLKTCIQKSQSKVQNTIRVDLRR